MTDDKHKDAEIEQLRQLIAELRHRFDIQAAMAEIHRNYVDAALRSVYTGGDEQSRETMMKRITFRCVKPGRHESNDGLYTITRGSDGWTIFDSVTTWDGTWPTLNAAKRAVWQVEEDADWQQ